MKLLFVSYRTANAVGNSTVELKDEETIESMSDIQELQSRIAQSQNLNDVIIDNMIMLPIK